MTTRVVDPEVLPSSSAPPSMGEVALRIQRLERLTKLLDEAIEVPFLQQRVGLDAIIGLAPIIGDLITALTASYIVYEAKQLGASRWLIARMSWNVAADVLGGIVPIAGDLFDMYYKANRKNLDLLKAALRKRGYDLAEDDRR